MGKKKQSLKGDIWAKNPPRMSNEVLDQDI